MQKLDKLAMCAARLGVPVDDHILRVEDALDGLFVEWKQYNATGILINSHRPVDVQAAALAEEIGHYLYSTGQIIQSKDVQAVKSEQAGRAFAYQCLLPCSELEVALEQGTCTAWELSEQFNLPEPFIRDAYSYYCQKGNLSLHDAECHWCYAV